MLNGNEETFAFSDCLRRGAGEAARLRFRVNVKVKLNKGDEEIAEIRENDISSQLAQLTTSDSSRCRSGPYFIASVVINS